MRAGEYLPRALSEFVDLDFECVSFPGVRNCANIDRPFVRQIVKHVVSLLCRVASLLVPGKMGFCFISDYFPGFTESSWKERCLGSTKIKRKEQLRNLNLAVLSSLHCNP